MNTIATKQPSAGTTPRRGKNFNLRAFFAGGAATVALIAAGVIVFGSLAAYVAFNGLPVGGGDGGGGRDGRGADGDRAGPRDWRSARDGAGRLDRHRSR